MHSFIDASRISLVCHFCKWKSRRWISGGSCSDRFSSTRKVTSCNSPKLKLCFPQDKCLYNGEFHWSFCSAPGSVDQIRDKARDPNGVAPPPDLWWNLTTPSGIGGCLPVVHLPGNRLPAVPDLEALVFGTAALARHVQRTSEVNNDVEDACRYTMCISVTHFSLNRNTR